MDKVANEVTRHGVAKGRCGELDMRSGLLGGMIRVDLAWWQSDATGGEGGGGKEGRTWTSPLGERLALPGLWACASRSSGVCPPPPNSRGFKFAA